MTKIYLTNEQLRSWCNIHRLKPEEAVVIGISRAMIYKYLNGTQTIPAHSANQCLLLDLLSIDIQEKYIRHKLKHEEFKS